MNNGDRIKRAIAFYISVLLFFVTLPILLSYSLGYRIDLNALKFYKTGIIFVNSKPAGTAIYVNGELFAGITPARIEDLKPGAYKVQVKREGFYPWEEELVVRPNMVTKAESIILFPVMKEMNRISPQPVTDFAVSDRNNIYYLTDHGLYRSDPDGSNIKKLSGYADWPKGATRKKFSPEGDKFLCFNEKEICVVYTNLDKALAPEGVLAKAENVLTAEEPIVDVFWYTGSGYIIVVTEKYINVVELRGAGKRNTATLYKFNTRPQSLYYDQANGSLYFADTGKGKMTLGGRYVYRLDLRQTFFDSLMQLLPKRENEPANDKR